MPAILRNILALIAGVVIGGVANMTIVSISGSVITLPEGVNPEDIESLKANIQLFAPKHFLMPFLAHAIGTFVGAFIAAYIAASRKMLLAMIVGGFFLAGGIMMVQMLPSPLWFTFVDLGLAYIPMGFMGWKLAESL